MTGSAPTYFNVALEYVGSFLFIYPLLEFGWTIPFSNAIISENSIVVGGKVTMDSISLILEILK